MKDHLASAGGPVSSGHSDLAFTAQSPPSAFHRRVLQIRDLFSMRAHHGWMHYLVHKLRGLFSSTTRMFHRMDVRLSQHSDLRSEAFDREHGTDTFSRRWVKCGRGSSQERNTWGYSPINQDFFREIMRAVPVRYEEYDFVDVGSGKGAAMMLASEFGFRRIIGVELSADLISIAGQNAERYRRSTRRAFHPELVHADFMEWSIPAEDALFFLNNPFPGELSLHAIQKLEASLERHPRRVLLVYRKAPGNVGSHLDGSSVWRPVRLAPYWRIYASLPVAEALASDQPRKTRRWL